MTIWYPGMSEEDEVLYNIELQHKKDSLENLSNLELQIKTLVSQYNKAADEIYNDKRIVYSVVPNMSNWPNRWPQDDSTDLEDIVEWGIQNHGWQSSSWNC